MSTAAQDLFYGGPYAAIQPYRQPRLRLIEGGRSRAAKPSSQSRAHRIASSARAARPHAGLAAAVAALLIGVALALVWVTSDSLVQARVESAWTQAPLCVITVVPGDSLWSIAEAHPLAGCTTAEVVHRIGTANGLSSGELHPGMRLTVPEA